MFIYTDILFLYNRFVKVGQMGQRVYVLYLYSYKYKIYSL